ncbi:MAG: D-2-hydroxyacid dehydrogenase [Pseudomonadota bacterium]
MSDLRIYVENKGERADAYSITDALVRAALPQPYRGAAINVCYSLQPDLESLGRATHFVGYGFDPQRIQRHARQVRVVHSLSAGVEGYLPLNWMPQGAVLTNSSGAQSGKGGAYGAMAILMLNERIPQHVASQRNAAWNRTPASAVDGKTVLVYGFGELGAAVARRIRPFGLRIVGVRHSGASHDDADEIIQPRQFRERLPEADFLVLSCPLTPETRGLIGTKELALLPEGAGLLNIARGPVVDTQALISALASGHLGGAVLDVFDVEPLPRDSALWSAPNLVITPHTSCDDARGDLAQCLAIFGHNVALEAQGLPMRNVVDPRLGY